MFGWATPNPDINRSGYLDLLQEAIGINLTGPVGLEAVVAGQRTGYVRMSTVDQSERLQLDGQIPDRVFTTKPRPGTPSDRSSLSCCDSPVTGIYHDPEEHWRWRQHITHGYLLEFPARCYGFQ